MLTRRVLAGASTVPVLLLVVFLTLPAVAVPSHPPDDEIDEARQAEQAVAGAVDALERRLAALTLRLDELAWSAARAAEDYNGARYALAEAREAERTAARQARLAGVTAERARIELGRVAAATYRAGGQFANLGLVLEAQGTEHFLDGAAALRTITRSQSGAYERAADASATADETAAEAQLTAAARHAATAAAEQAFEGAMAAAAEQEALIAAVERERDDLVAELAAARNTTIALEEERQAALADEAAERERNAGAEPDAGSPVRTGAEQEPPAEGEIAAARPARGGNATPEDAGRTPLPEPTRTAADAAPRSPSGTMAPSPAAPSRTSAPAPPPTSAPPPPPPKPSPTPAPPPIDASGADRAVAYARAQLGKPYQWGAAGPDAFDCSGLTMRAWQQGGKQLPHWSVAQARVVTRVSYAELRPGDLIFWSDNGQPSGTYHVGLFIGDGLMIHAPRPGRVVEVQRVFYWRTPSFYGRV